jgi:hypothetical protein
MTATSGHRLEGLEPDNLLAFLALLGLLRALESVDETCAKNDKLLPRAAWDIDTPPLRPILFLARAVTPEEVATTAAKGVEAIAATYDFGGEKDLKFPRKACRTLLQQEARAACFDNRGRVDLFAALMSDAAIKDDKKGLIDPTPLCLISGSGHQHFLERLAVVTNQPTPQKDKSGKKTAFTSAVRCLAATLFQPWSRADDLTSSFRWDPEEDVRYALMAGDPSDRKYKAGTQHGANRLAAIGLAELSLVPEKRAGRVRSAVLGGASETHGFSFASPIWRDLATRVAIRALLGHPDLRKPYALKHLGVDHVMVAQRTGDEYYKNFSRARPL